MSIPTDIKIKNNPLPPRPGVYIMRDARGAMLYIGKATSLRTRVSSYFTRPSDARIATMVSHIASIEYIETPTAIEALMLEAKLIKKHQPPYNVDEKDDKSFIFLVFSKEPFPQPLLIRGHELTRMSKRSFLRTFGPFRSAHTVQAALDALRPSFPWSTCKTGRSRPCFYHHLRLCPGVCTGEITSREYRRIIRGLISFFTHGRTRAVKELEQQMKLAAKEERFEDAGRMRDRLYHLEHIKDIAVIKRESLVLNDADRVNIFGRIEGYDISNTGGQNAVGSMVVFNDGRPSRKEYRTFGIRTLHQPNDVGMLREVLTRRFVHADSKDWPLPDLILIDGGLGQIHAAHDVLKKYNLRIPLVGIAKGFNRKQDELVYDKSDHELSRLVHAFKPMLQHLRDESHRFAITMHRKKRGKAFLQ